MAQRAAHRLDEIRAALHRVRLLRRVEARVERLHLVRVHRPDGLARERHDVVGQVPHLGVLGRVGKRRHRRPGHAGAEPQVDVARRAAAMEGPGLGEVGGGQRLIPIVLERGRDGARAPAVRAVTTEAAKLVVHLPAARDALGRARDRRARRHRHRLLPGKSRRQRLDVGDDVGDVRVGEDLVPRRHGGAVQPLPHRPGHVVVCGDAAGFGRPDLVLARGEVARSRREERSGGSVAFAALAVALDAVRVVDRFPARRDLGLCSRRRRRLCAEARDDRADTGDAKDESRRADGANDGMTGGIHGRALYEKCGRESRSPG